MRRYTSAILSTSFWLSLCLLSTQCNKGNTAINNNNSSDSTVLTVVNGYGTGKYKVGDTVHIWSTAIANDEVFDSWTGYTNLNSNAGEWHNSFIMPSQNVTITGNKRNISPFTLQYEKIKGKNNLKKVYYYFPPGHKGIVFLLHGTSGSANGIITNYEWILMIKDLVDANFAVIVTEAEEATLNTDLNGDGKIRWSTFPADSVNNVDYANIKALTDTFYHRGYTNSTVPKYSIGMSNGGSFSAALSALYKFKSGISYCASSTSAVFATSVTPFQFCMAKFDDNPEVGAQGNADALANSQTLITRSICSKYFLHDHSPVYNERFARRGDISISTSANIVSELKNNGWIDTRNYLKSSSANIVLSIQTTPSHYPVLLGLTLEEQQYVANEIEAMFAAHQFYSDYNKTTIKFLNSQCQ